MPSGNKPLPEAMLTQICDAMWHHKATVNPLRAEFFWGNINIYLHFMSFLHIDLTQVLNTLRPRQHGRHFPDDIFRCIFLNENIWIAINISLSFVPKGPIDTIPALVQIMAWRRSGDKPLSEPMVVSLLTHICITRPQWVKTLPQVREGPTYSI